jgi:hypothetical protein
MSNYEDRPLIGYIPTVLKKVRQFQALTYSEQPEIFNLFAEIQTVLNNQFVETSTEYGVKRWETILGIVPKATDSFDARKTKILIRLNEQLPYTLTTFINMLGSLYGENFELITNFNEYEMELITHIGENGGVDNLKYLIQSVVPANLVVISTNSLECITSGQIRVSSGIISTIVYMVTNDFSDTYDANGMVKGGSTLVQSKIEFITNDFETIVSANGSATNKSASVIVTEYQI